MSRAKRGVLSYLALSFGMAWSIWVLPLWLGLSPLNPLFQLAVLPGGFAPALAAIVVRKWITKEGFVDAGLGLNLRHWRLYLVGWLLPYLVTAVIVTLVMGLGIGQPDFSLQRALRTLSTANGRIPTAVAPEFIPLIPIQLLLTSLIATPILWGEEFGWRGYLQIRLLAQRPLLSALITGLIWGVWHYPILLRGYNFPETPLLGLALFPVSTVLLSIIFGWLRLRTGSVWPASLAHAATNAIGGSLTLLLFLGGPKMILAGYLGVLGWIPLGALAGWIVWSGKLRESPPRSRGERESQKPLSIPLAGT